MATQSIDINDIVNYLRSVPAINAITGNRIYVWPPVSHQDGIFIVVDLVSQRVDIWSKTAILEFSFIAHNDNVAKKQLLDLQQIVTDEIVYSTDCWAKTFNTFSVFKVVEWSMFELTVNNFWKNLLIHNYIFYFDIWA